MKKAALILFVFSLAMPALAQAANPCTDPFTAVSVNPRTVFATLPEFGRVLVTGGVAIPGYEFGWMVPGATAPTSTLPVIVKASWTLVTGTTDCYSAQLAASTPIPVGQKFVGSLRAIGDPVIGNGQWSVAGNPFGFEGPPSSVGKPILK